MLNHFKSQPNALIGTVKQEGIAIGMDMFCLKNYLYQMNLKLGKAMGNSLDEKAYTKMITCINPQKSSEEMSKCVLFF